MGIYTIIVSRWHNGVRTFAIRDGYESDTYLIPFIVKQDHPMNHKGGDRGPLQRYTWLGLGIETGAPLMLSL